MVLLLFTKSQFQFKKGNKKHCPVPEEFTTKLYRN